MDRRSKQFPKNKEPEIKRAVQIKESTSLEIKQSFARLWLQEKPYKKYAYCVEKCDDGSQVFLHRPTYKHGLDFAVSVEGFRSTLRKNKSERPSHDDIFKDLKDKTRRHPHLRAQLFKAVTLVYECVEPDVVLRRLPRLRAASPGLAMDKVLRIIKWLFIEQDVTYWLGTGRNMFMSAIERTVFGLDAELFE